GTRPAICCLTNSTTCLRSSVLRDEGSPVVPVQLRPWLPDEIWNSMMAAIEPSSIRASSPVNGVGNGTIDPRGASIVPPIASVLAVDALTIRSGAHHVQWCAPTSCYCQTV